MHKFNNPSEIRNQLNTLLSDLEQFSLYYSKTCSQFEKGNFSNPKMIPSIISIGKQIAQQWAQLIEKTSNLIDQADLHSTKLANQIFAALKKAIKTVMQTMKKAQPKPLNYHSMLLEAFKFYNKKG